MTRDELEELMRGRNSKRSAEIASLKAQLAEARNAALEEAARVVGRWHISKGGFTALAEAIRALKSPAPGGEK